MSATTPLGLSSFPVLSIITWSPFVGALLIMFLARRNALLVRWLAVASTALSLLLSIVVYIAYDRDAATVFGHRVALGYGINGIVGSFRLNIWADFADQSPHIEFRKNDDRIHISESRYDFGTLPGGHYRAAFTL